MNLCSKSTIKQLLRNYGLFPLKRLGQNFLVNKNALRKIMREARPLSEYTVLEIGPGFGTITQALAQKAEKVIAVEKDPKMCEILKENVRLWECKNVEIVQGDILQFLNSKLKTKNLKLQLKTQSYKLVANLPFYLTAPVIRKFLESPWPPKEMLLIVQKEVAQRICARPNFAPQNLSGQAKTQKMNLLAISVQFYSQPKIIDYISRKSFWPQPKVDSALIKLEVKSSKLKVDRESFFKLVRAGFSQPRKKLVNNLSQNLVVEKKTALAWLKNAKIRENVRAENLKVEDWILLAKSWQNFPENIH